MRFPELQRMEGVSGGQVCLKGTGLTVECVVGLFVAGEPICEIAEQYGVPPSRVVQAIQCVVAASYGERGELPVRVTRRMDALVPLAGTEPPG